MKKRWQSYGRLMSLLTLLALVLTGCGDQSISALNPAGPVAQEQMNLMMLSLLIMVLVVVVVYVIWGIVLVKYRKRKHDKDIIPKQVEGSHKLELIWTVGPMILLLILAVPTLTTLFKLEKTYSKEEGALQVKVVAHQFWWEFQYPDLGITTGQDLYIPTGKKIQFDLSSVDVIHSFWIPALGGKTDTNPHAESDNNKPQKKNHMWLEAEKGKEGVYRGKCAELCGASHALMDFKVVAVTEAEFNNWVSKMQAPTPAATTATAQKGEAIFKQQCIGCHAIDAKLPNIANFTAAGPNLSAVGDRQEIAGILSNNPNEADMKNVKIDEQKLKQNIVTWITDTKKVKPGNLMPSFNTLKADEKEALAEYLSTLKKN